MPMPLKFRPSAAMPRTAVRANVVGPTLSRSVVTPSDSRWGLRGPEDVAPSALDASDPPLGSSLPDWVGGMAKAAAAGAVVGGIAVGGVLDERAQRGAVTGAVVGMALNGLREGVDTANSIPKRVGLFTTGAVVLSWMVWNEFLSWR